MKRILVTGAAGFIGSNFVRYWLAKYPQDLIVAYDALTYAGNRESLAGLEHYSGFEFVHADICDTDRVKTLLKQQEIDTIVHFAAESHVDRSISGPDAFINTNVVGTHSLLQAARICWLQPGKEKPHLFHHVSTDEVFGSLNDLDAPFTESAAYSPNSPYSATKAGSDFLVRAYHHTYGLRVTTSNCSNNYGPYQLPEKLIPLSLVSLLSGVPVPVYGDGGNIRDWLYVDDHCRGLELVLRKGRTGETYNIGGNNQLNNLALVESLCDLVDEAFATDAKLSEVYPKALAANRLQSRQAITFVADRPGHDWRYAIDASKISSELGYQPIASLETGLLRTLRWYLDNRAWWSPLVERADPGSDNNSEVD